MHNQPLTKFCIILLALARAVPVESKHVENSVFLPCRAVVGWNRWKAQCRHILVSNIVQTAALSNLGIPPTAAKPISTHFEQWLPATEPIVANPDQARQSTGNYF